MSSLSLFPFSSLSNAQLSANFNATPDSINNIDLDLKKMLVENLTEEITEALEFKYYTPCQLNDLANRYKCNVKLSMFHVNVRSLNANCNNLISFLHSLSFNFDVIIISEVWSTDLQYYFCLLPNYDFFCDPPVSRAGGVVIFVKRSLKAVQTSRYDAPLSINKSCHYEHVWIEINVDNCNYVIGGYYRHPNTPVKDFTDDFLYTLDKLKNLKRCYAFGDFNVCLANYSHHVITSEYIDAVFDSKFLPYVFMPTRFTNHSASIIDHVYSNDLFVGNHVCKTGLIINDIADHCANLMFLIDNDLKVKKNNTPIESLRNF